jgi:alpha-methylacyl-CoA racemase
MGPLHGLKVVEMSAIGPVPMCCMLLADLGATVLRVDRQTPSNLGRPRPLRYNLPFRGRKAIPVDLKRPESIELVLTLVEKADVLVEGFRPGVMERLGLGPDACLKRNERLVYGRMTGWGQDGPLALVAGHDLNYIALTGALNAIGRRGQPPTQPLNLVGDFGGGALYLAFGIMSAIYERQSSGRGQVVDAAIVDGVASLMASLHGMNAAGMVSERGTNPTDSGSYYANTYQCADGKWVSICAIEEKFHAELLRLLELDPKTLPAQSDRGGWDKVHALLTDLFKTRTRAQWSDLLEGTDACFAPVLSLDEAPRHPHMAARGTYAEIDGIVQPMPAPRFSRTVPDRPTPPEPPDPARANVALEGWLPQERIAELQAINLFGKA